jgi:hypothetical protein
VHGGSVLTVGHYPFSNHRVADCLDFPSDIAVHRARRSADNLVEFRQAGWGAGQIAEMV